MPDRNRKAMDEKSGKADAAGSSKPGDARKQRLAAALRDNLRKRKQRLRDPGEAGGAPAPTAPDKSHR